MKRVFATALLCLSLLAFPALAAAVPIDASSGGAEITAPDEMILHNVLAGSNYYYGVFKWNQIRNIWKLTESGLEEPTFNTQEYYPLEDGTTWTYQVSDATTLTLTVNGTEEICGIPCIRLDDSNGGSTFWINDETGVSMTRFLNPDGTNTTWCPPMKIAPPQMYIGTMELNSFTDAPFGYLGGPQLGSHSGWSSFVVKGLEDVTVPAGTFTDCVRLTFVYSFRDEWSDLDGYRIEEVWYAKDLGIVKRASTDTGFVGTSVWALNSKVTELTGSSLLPSP